MISKPLFQPPLALALGLRLDVPQMKKTNTAGIVMGNVPEHLRKEYDVYIRSAEWKRKRMGFILGNVTTERRSRFEDADSKYLCDVCEWEWRIEELEVHHLHYRTLKRERREDVLVVCKKCHDEKDIERAMQGKERSKAALARAKYRSGFETWITKRHGEGAIEDYWDDEYEHELFQDFIEDNKEW